MHAAYLAAGANRQTAAADWAADNDGGVLVYGAGVNLAVWRPRANAGVDALLAGHTGTVKAVASVLSTGEVHYFVSGGDDRALRLWAVPIDSVDSVEPGRCIQTVDDAHTAPVNCIAAERTLLDTGTSLSRLFATGAADYTIKIWAFDADADADTLPIRLVQTIETKPRFFPLCLALVSLATGEGDTHAWLLAAAGTNNRIQLLTGTRDAKFTLEATLPGHEGWVRSLDFTWETRDAPATSDLLLASASQDKYVRLWRVHRGSTAAAPSASAAAAASLLGEEGLLPSLEPGVAASTPSNRAHRLRAAGQDYAATFEALLFGHEDWVYSARWDTDVGRRARLLTASADNSLAVWEADEASGIWVTTARLGELSKEKGATTATGSVGGFWAGLWGPGAQAAVLCRTGSWRRWVFDQAADRWVPATGVAGHVQAVTGVAWARNGAYLLSASTDQTTRLHACTVQTGWHELARPQIHGYDLNCIDTLGDARFVSGADEKLLRVFHEPKSAARLLADLGVAPAHDLDTLPDAANMPVLGLSNKAVDVSDLPAEDASDGAAPPLEDVLARSTLWPETEKLYGHGYEISSLAVSHDARLVASACRASSLNHAVVRLWETERWTEVRPPLAQHALTVTRLRFSPDDTLLLSVGRDRQWAVFARTAPDASEFVLRASREKAHTRMLLDCAWGPLLPSGRRVFATAGRDKNVKVWADAENDDNSFALAATVAQDHPVTAIDILPRLAAGAIVLAVGTEAGRLSIVTLNAQTLAVTSVRAVDAALCLPKAVLQLAWRPSDSDSDSSDSCDLAVAGDDASLRVYTVDL